MQEQTRKNTILYVLYTFAFAAVMLFLFWKCRYGFAGRDEAFYLTVPYRLCLGDGLLLHEWHLSQLSGFLLYPIMWLHRLFFSDNTGLLYHFRLIFTTVWGLGALFFFYRLSRFSLPGAMPASLAFLLYAPFGIMALSYNSMGILLLLNAGIIAVSARRRLALQYTAAGVFLAGAVLCCPYLILLYLLFSAAALVLALRRKHGVLFCWGCISLGCGLLLLLFCLVVFSRASFAELRQVFPELLNDPEHQRQSFLNRAYFYLVGIFTCNRAFLPGLGVAVVSVIFAWVTKKRGIGFVAVSLACLVILYFFAVENQYINYMMLPINLLGLYCVLTAKDDITPIRRLFWGIWAPGAVYSFCINCTSNQGFYVISSASTVMTVSSIVILAVYMRGLLREESSRPLRAAIAAAAVLLLSFQLYEEAAMRYISVFGESGMAAQTSIAETGPERGLLMSPKRLERYQTLEADAERIRADTGTRRVLFLSQNTHLYLSAEKEMATFSAWLGAVDEESIQRLDRYYELFPEKQPDAIYIEQEYASYAQHFVAQGYHDSVWASGAHWLTRT